MEMNKINTHKIYNTISHEHLDDLVHFSTGEHPDSGLLIVECENGSWFIEQDYGNAFDSFSGISKPHVHPYLNPVFYENREEALAVSIELIKLIHKGIDESKISEYLKQE